MVGIRFNIACHVKPERIIQYVVLKPAWSNLIKMKSSSKLKSSAGGRKKKSRPYFTDHCSEGKTNFTVLIALANNALNRI